MKRRLLQHTSKLLPHSVIPGEAIAETRNLQPVMRFLWLWIPACAGMTGLIVI